MDARRPTGSIRSDPHPRAPIAAGPRAGIRARPPVSSTRARRGRRTDGRRRAVAVAAGAFAVLVVVAVVVSQSPPRPAGVVARTAPSAAPAASEAAPAAVAGAATSAEPAVGIAAASPSVAGPAAGSAATFPLALVAPVDDLRTGYTSAQVRSLVAAGKVLVPCGVAGVTVGGESVAVPADCAKATAIPAAVRKTPSRIALLPAGLVDPRVKVLTVDGADLFGNTVVRARAYPVTGASDSLPAELAGPATLYDPGDVRTLVSTGDTCPDRTVSLWAVVKGKGWDWTLEGGTARYTGTYMDRRFDGPTGNGWEVVKAVRTGKGIGAVWSMIRDADIAVNDFECPMVADFTQHESGTFFTIDPEVAGLMKRVGMDVLSLASNHITDLGAKGVLQTIRYADAAGVKHAGAGKDLVAAMAPAIVDVRGLRFAILSWDATRQATQATGTSAGAMRATTGAVKKAVANARKKADVVIAMPQWNWPEYSAAFSATARDQRDAWYAAGVDHILGSGTHWASGISITKPDPDKGWRLAVTSHGNFLFGQDWSRQTQEGVIYEATFRGTDLVQVRLHPYIVMDGAQPSLVASKTDGAFVQRQVFRASDLP